MRDWAGHSRQGSAGCGVCAPMPSRTGSFGIHVGDTSHLYVWHKSFICVTGQIYMCDMTHSRQGIAGCGVCVPLPSRMGFLGIHVGDMSHLYLWHDSFVCVTWHISTCNMTHSRQGSAGCGACAQMPTRTSSCGISASDMKYLYLWHEPFISVTWLIYMCNITHSRQGSAGCGVCAQVSCGVGHSGMHLCDESYLCVCMWVLHICE